jgi:hypothetical protein
MGPDAPGADAEPDDRAVTEEIVLPQAEIVEYFGFVEPESDRSDSDVRMLGEDD